jgi:hypothetical protein
MQTYILTVDLILLHNSRCTSLLTIVIFPRLFSQYSPAIIFFIFSLWSPIIVSTYPFIYPIDHPGVPSLYRLPSNCRLNTVSEATQTRSGT